MTNRLIGLLILLQYARPPARIEVLVAEPEGGGSNEILV